MSPRIAVAATGDQSLRAGLDVAAAGGNAVDAALAAAFVALATEPGLVSFGGGAFINVWPAAGDPVVVDDTFEISVDSTRGRLPCPFGHPGLYPNEVVTVRNIQLDETLTFTRLNIHLIASHGFYEGVGSPYRLDPTTLARVLGCGVHQDPG